MRASHDPDLEREGLDCWKSAEAQPPGSSFGYNVRPRASNSDGDGRDAGGRKGLNVVQALGANINVTECNTARESPQTAFIPLNDNYSLYVLLGFFYPCNY